LVGIRSRGVPIANRLSDYLRLISNQEIPVGILDITLYRDDLSTIAHQPVIKGSQLDFEIEDAIVVLVDDVLFTGRSINSALTAVQSFGRPLEIELLTLIDRRFSRHLPIQPDYRGRQVDAINGEKVKVCWKENDGEDAVYLVAPNFPKP